MGQNSKIEWTDETFNPWWGCEKVSPGCAHCYAETWAKRFGVQWGGKARRRFFGAAHWEQLSKWDRAAEREGQPRKVFVASMADVLEDLPESHPDHEAMEGSRQALKVFTRECKHLIFQFLTKRPENFHLLDIDWENTPNAWAGVTVENQEQAVKRLPLLLKVPAAVRFASCEPLLERIELHEWLPFDPNSFDPEFREGLEWVIVGGESGPGARGCHIMWIRDVLQSCRIGGVPCFVKQLGGHAILDIRYDRSIIGWSRRLKHSKGADMTEWPEDVQVREFPTMKAA